MDYQKKKILLLVIFITIVARGGLFAQVLSNPNASQITKDVYNYLYKYKNDPDNCVIIGQNLGHKNYMLGAYQDYIVRLQDEIGITPGLLGGDLGLNGDVDTIQLVQMFETYFKSGGIVSLSAQMRNPWNGTYDADDQYEDFRRLLDENDTLHNKWMLELDGLANFMEKLKDKNIPVLWRPFSDMNGDWFWWGADEARPAKDFHDMWKYMYNYFTNERGLNNLIWVFSVNQSTIKTNNPEEWLKGYVYYPGADFVDIVGMSIFDDNLEIKEPTDYTDLKQFLKPMVLTLCGPTQSTSDGNYDYYNFFHLIQEKYPEIVYANVVHSFDNQLLSLVDNQNYDKLLMESCVVNKGEIDLEITWPEPDQNLDGLSVDPQPAGDYFIISAPRIIEGPIDITILNMYGETVVTLQVDKVYRTQVDLPKLASGTYILQISTKTDSFQKKLVLQ